ncbi:hypothetical protein [Telluribacter sp.]|jgi:hypothetical protein|uniref:hypothetical protein n=1 Tax=Telluribacter sp. TaxID=1978767 RepID=UPI002E130DE7|nr:hypothetical protein [Telluribacter sp.]
MIVPKSEARPPGKKLLKKMTTRTKWLLLAPVSLMLIGYGLCVFSEASNLKHTGAPTINWVLLGTYSLVLINAGISLFGQAVRYRVQMDFRRELRRSSRKMLKELEARKKPGKKAKSPTKTN